MRTGLQIRRKDQLHECPRDRFMVAPVNGPGSVRRLVVSLNARSDAIRGGHQIASMHVQIGHSNVGAMRPLLVRQRAVFKGDQQLFISHDARIPMSPVATGWSCIAKRPSPECIRFPTPMLASLRRGLTRPGCVPEWLSRFRRQEPASPCHRDDSRRPRVRIRVRIARSSLPRSCAGSCQ